MSVTTLSILKNTRVPDGLQLIYPALNCASVFFTPSLLLSLDDPILGGSFLKLANESYCKGVKGINQLTDYILSP